jgi:hypothetical protein
MTMALTWMLMMLAAEVRVAVGAEEVEDAAVLVGMVIAVVGPPEMAPPPHVRTIWRGTLPVRVRQVIRILICYFIKKLLGCCGKTVKS